MAPVTVFLGDACLPWRASFGERDMAIHRGRLHIVPRHGARAGTMTILKGVCIGDSRFPELQVPGRLLPMLTAHCGKPVCLSVIHGAVQAIRTEEGTRTAILRYLILGTVTFASFFAIYISHPETKALYVLLCAAVAALIFLFYYVSGALDARRLRRIDFSEVAEAARIDERVLALFARESADATRRLANPYWGMGRANVGHAVRNAVDRATRELAAWSPRKVSIAEARAIVGTVRNAYRDDPGDEYGYGLGTYASLMAGLEVIEKDEGPEATFSVACLPEMIWFRSS